MTDAERYERGQEIVREVEREFAGRPMEEMVEEVRARVEKLMVTEGGSYCSYLMKPMEEGVSDKGLVVSKDEELIPNHEPLTTASRAFPDSFYYKPVITEEARPVQVWVTQTENFGARSHADWGRSEPPVLGLMCQCGHPAEAHAPACVFLIQGCGCEGFLKVPQGVVEGGG